MLGSHFPLVADLEDLAENVGEVLAPVEAQQSADHAVVANFLSNYLKWDGNRARVRRAQIGNLAQS